jgi:hypothetical protein
MAGPVEIRLVLPEHMKGLTCEPVMLAANESEGKLQLSFADSLLGPWNMPLTVRATAMRDGSPYTAEATLAVVQHEPQSADTVGIAGSR